MDDRYRWGAHSVYDIKDHFAQKTKYGYGVLCGDLSLGLRQILGEICASQNLGSDKLASNGLKTFSAT